MTYAGSRNHARAGNVPPYWATIVFESGDPKVENYPLPGLGMGIAAGAA